MKPISISLLILMLLVSINCTNKAVSQSEDVASSIPKLANTAFLEIDGQTVFDGDISMNASLSKYTNQLLFTVVDDQGQHVTITLAGKDINSRRPKELTFNSPGLFHGYLEIQDVFFIAFARLDADRDPGQLKYERHWSYHIMEGKLKVLNWTDTTFEFEFEGKMGNAEEVDSPDSWLPFKGRIISTDYQSFDN
ncbi:hypothetical protein ACFSKL_21355 [Belliella marina]|uniref:Uncharacterized protein n=1 Tax=Belliella marina TaxID=1644146 RepID=A0ABW4VRJ6_9BACT